MNTLVKQLSVLVLMVLSGAAFAEGAPAQSAGGGIEQFILLGGFVLIFYFLMWRPQSKRVKEHKNLVANLGKGDEVITNGGVAGKITKVTDDFVVVEVSEGTELKIQKVAVSSVLPKGTLKGI